MSETAAPHPDFSRSPGHGIWNRRDGRHYNDSFLLLLFNPYGTFAGTIRVNQNIELDASGDRWNDNATFQIFDANGNEIVTGCSTAVGTRFE